MEVEGSLAPELEEMPMERATGRGGRPDSLDGVRSSIMGSAMDNRQEGEGPQIILLIQPENQGAPGSPLWQLLLCSPKYNLEKQRST